jgi:hypothetical protein
MGAPGLAHSLGKGHCFDVHPWALDKTVRQFFRSGTGSRHSLPWATFGEQSASVSDLEILDFPSGMERLRPTKRGRVPEAAARKYIQANFTDYLHI